jgi:hypothetical protein
VAAHGDRARPRDLAGDLVNPSVAPVADATRADATPGTDATRADAARADATPGTDASRADATRADATPGTPPEPVAPSEARVIGPTTAATGETLQRVLAKLDIPRDYAAVLGVWPRPDGGVEVQLSPGTFWRTVQRARLAVTSTEHPERLFPHRHAFVLDGIECLTFSAEPVLPPGVLTPGYALRLT